METNTIDMGHNKEGGFSSSQKPPHKKRLLIVTDAWFPQVNGVVTTLEQTIERLSVHDIDIQVIHPGMFFGINILPKDNIRLFIPVGIARLRKIILEYRPDFIHIETEGLLGLTMRMLCQGMRLKFTTSYHTNFSQYLALRMGKLFYRITNNYIKWFHQKSESIIVSTSGMQSDLKKMGLFRVKVRPLGVNLDIFERNIGIRKKFKEPIFLLFGRLAEEKSPREFFECQLPGKKWVIGDGPIRNELQRRYGRQAKFFGIKKGDDLVDILSQCDVLVFPSRTETFGLTIIEALACGIPVAAHDVRGPQDIIENGKDGYLSENLRDAAIKCLDIPRENCRRKALQFSWENSVEVFVDCLVDSEYSSDLLEKDFLKSLPYMLKRLLLKE